MNHSLSSQFFFNPFFVRTGKKGENFEHVQNWKKRMQLIIKSKIWVPGDQ